MIPANLQPLANHLWQSTLFAVPVALLALALRKNRAAVRYWLWLAASVKFLIPFSLLVDAGSRIQWRSHPAISQPQFAYAVDQIARPFAMLAPAPVETAAPSAPVEFSTILLGVWLCGAAIGAVCWFRSWRRISAAKRTASPLDLKLPIPAFSTPGQMEPGVFGIRKPVLLLPEGILDRLTPAQLQAVFAHELCHVRRRDNLTAAIHTVVETIFWFHPLVWWIRARLVEEREHACDEEVLGKVGDAQDYAEGILNVCKLYLESPLRCVSGVMGSNLKKRVHSIIHARTPLELNFRRKILLGVAGFAVIAGPVAVGTANAPRGLVQSTAGAASAPGFEVPKNNHYEVVSIKPGVQGLRENVQYSQTAPAVAMRADVDPPRAYDVCSVKPSSGKLDPTFGPLAGGGFTSITNPAVALVVTAFDVRDFQVFGLPAWAKVDRYDVACKDTEPADAKEPYFPRMRSGVQALLADRFRLQYHRGVKRLPAVTLRVGKRGLKLTPSKGSTRGGGYSPTSVTAKAWSMAELASTISALTGEKVIDKTSVAGRYDFDLKWTREDRTAGAEPGKDAKPAALPEGPLLVDVLNERLGLTIRRTVESTEVIFVDHIEKPGTN